MPQIRSRTVERRKLTVERRELLAAREPLAAKVPEIIVLFWVLKVLTTGMGEAMSDFLGSVSVPLAAAIGIFGLGFAMWLQLRTREYRAPVYWFAVMMVAIFGTMAADGVHVGVDAPYAAVLATFALGTAVGDLTAVSLKLGFFDSAMLFAAIIMVPAIGWWRFDLNPIVAFWSAYIVTRPLGASIADWLGKPTSRTGLGLGDGLVSAIALVVFIALVAYIAVTKRDIQQAVAVDEEAHPRRAHPQLASAIDGTALQPSPADG